MRRRTYGLITICLDVKDSEEKERLRLELEEAELYVTKKYSKEASIELLISENKACLEEGRRGGLVLIALSDENSIFSVKADLVIFELAHLDADTIFQVWCHAKGLPYVIGETEALLVRELAKEDVSDFVKIKREEHIRAFLSENGLSVAEEEERLNAYIRTVYSFYGFGIYGLFLKAENKLIGAVSLDVKNSTGEVLPEVGFFLSDCYLGKGYGIMGLELLLNFAFSTFEMEKLVSVTAASNIRALNLLVRAGFKSVFEGEEIHFSLKREAYQRMRLDIRRKT